MEQRLAQWRLNKGLRGSAQRGFIDPAPDFTGEQMSRVITRFPVKGPVRRVWLQRVTRKKSTVPNSAISLSFDVTVFRSVPFDPCICVGSPLIVHWPHFAQTLPLVVGR